MSETAKQELSSESLKSYIGGNSHLQRQATAPDALGTAGRNIDTHTANGSYGKSRSYGNIGRGKVTPRRAANGENGAQENENPVEPASAHLRFGRASFSGQRPYTPQVSGTAGYRDPFMSDDGEVARNRLGRTYSLAAFQYPEQSRSPLSRQSTMLSVSSFSEKVARFDKAEWERAVERRIQREFRLAMKAQAKRKKPRADLIDVDLIKGSTFSKKKPLGTGTRMNQGFLRVFFLPLYRDYWSKEIPTAPYLLLSALWAAHTSTLVAYFNLEDDDSPSITQLEVIMPVVMLVLLAAMYASVAAPKFARADDDDDTDEEREQESDRSGESDNLMVSTDEGDDDQDVIGKTVGVSAKINATLYDENGDPRKLEMTLEQISHMLLAKVSMAPENNRFLYVGAVISFISAALPIGHRLYSMGIMHTDLTLVNFSDILEGAFGDTALENLMVMSSFVGTFLLSFCVVFALAIAEHTYFQRYLHAKYFSALTSSRRARRYGLPHFRLHKVANIKMWLSLRSFIKRRGPQRSVDTIVSFSFLLVLGLVAVISLKSTTGNAGLLLTIYDWQIVIWAFMLSVYLLRFMTLGSHINQKFQNEALILTEQINLYLRMEQAPHKKEDLGICNNVLTLSGRLLKDIESPYKISGMSMSPMMYNITRVIVLSAFSSVLSDLFGFKLKIWKISKK